MELVINDATRMCCGRPTGSCNCHPQQTHNSQEEFDPTDVMPTYSWEDYDDMGNLTADYSSGGVPMLHNSNEGEHGSPMPQVDWDQLFAPPAKPKPQQQTRNVSHHDDGLEFDPTDTMPVYGWDDYTDQGILKSR